MIKRLILTAVLFVLFEPSSMAQSSREYAVMSRSAWSAFECSALAAQFKDTKEQERLFVYGYKEGKTFIAALQARKIDQRDLSSETPWLMGLLLEGPTPDFMLGRMYEAAQEAALKPVLKTANSLNPDDLRRTLAQNEYNKMNCRLIGPPK